MGQQNTFKPVAPDAFQGKKWRKPVNYAFATTRSLLPIVGSELPRAAMAMPIAFVRSEDVFVPVVVMGVRDDKNVFVAQNGRWLSTFIPSPLQSYPFALLPTGDGRHVLCVDQASGLVEEAGNPASGEAFFSEDGQLSASVQAIFEFLKQVENYRSTALGAIQALDDKALIQPWPLTLQIGKEAHEVRGLYRVDEQSMNALANEKFVELRQSGALLLAYTQLLSMQHMETVRSLAEAHMEAESLSSKPLLPPGGELDLSFMQGDTLRFS